MKNTAYYISYDTTAYALVFHIHAKLAEEVRKLPEDNLLAESYREKFPECTFEPDCTKAFGLDNCSLQAGRDGEYLKLIFPLPKAVLLDSPCERCEGTGIRLGSKCFYCEGTGKQADEKNKERLLICHSIHILLRYLEMPIWNKQLDLDQHFLLVTAMGSDPGHKGIGGGVSEAFVAATRKLYDETCLMFPDAGHAGRQPDFVFDEAEEAMTDAWCHMHISSDRKDRAKIGNRAVLKPEGHIYIECPGVNGCSLYTSTSIPYFFDDGYPLSDHNVDGTVQQLTLLVGFAKACEEIVKHL